MAEAVIAVHTEAGASLELVPDVEALSGVREAHVVAGGYDVLVEATGETPSAIIRDVAAAVRGMDGVETTRTYVVIG